MSLARLPGFTLPTRMELVMRKCPGPGLGGLIVFLTLKSDQKECEVTVWEQGKFKH